MTPERWQQIKRLYGSAAARGEPERAAYLEAACAGDSDLRREVESLLGYDGADFVEVPALDAAAREITGNPPALVGKQLGAYRVLALAGSGGMGDVYRAHDGKLGRDVALKVLPEVFAHDAERLARFRREAQLLAALNHPNIATIHGLEESDGLRFLVLELVPGQSLAKRLHAGPSVSTRPSPSPPRSPSPSKPPTTRASSTATSSPPTSRSPPTTGSRSSTSASPSPSPQKPTTPPAPPPSPSSPPARAPSSAPPPT